MAHIFSEAEAPTVASAFCPDCRDEHAFQLASQDAQYVRKRVPLDPLRDRYCQPHLHARLHSDPADDAIQETLVLGTVSGRPETGSISTVLTPPPAPASAEPFPSLLDEPVPPAEEAVVAAPASDPPLPPRPDPDDTEHIRQAAVSFPISSMVEQGLVERVQEELRTRRQQEGEPASHAPGDAAEAWLNDTGPVPRREEGTSRPIPLASDVAAASARVPETAPGPAVDAAQATASAERLAELCCFLESTTLDALKMNAIYVERLAAITRYLPRVPAPYRPFFQLFLLRFHALEEAYDKLARTPVPTVLPAEPAPEVETAAGEAGPRQEEAHA